MLPKLKGTVHLQVSVLYCTCCASFMKLSSGEVMYAALGEFK